MMKKLILFLLILFWHANMDAQKKDPSVGEIETSETNNVLLDNYGNRYNLSDLKIKERKPKSKQSYAVESTMLCSSGIFNLYFDEGCGMEDVNSSLHNARRAVLCKVFSDISDFLNTPLNTTGNKVNIWVRNINNIPNVPSAALGGASSFYSMPNNTTAGFGGIVDNEIWKTVHTGVDSFVGIASPLATSGGGSFYHGYVTINFNNVTPSNAIWNTDLSINAPSNLHDLYSVVLHEVTHALGFASLISTTGASLFGNGYNYYSRYDRFLKNNANTQFLITTANSCPMYNFVFNAALTATVLHPNISSCVTDQTTCSTALRYVSSINVPIYTPNCYESGSSLSHFEDQCVSPNINNGYFAMCNAGGTGVTKRFLKTQERQTLCDIGYAVKTTFGATSTFNGTINYGGSSCAGITVAGVNDGINPDGTIAFTGDSGTNITVTGILNNDYSVTPANLRFEGLQDITDPSATVSATTGIATTSVTLNSSVTGVHLLRYVPFDNITLQRGNITYIYVYVFDTGGCRPIPSACDLLANGNFEQNSMVPIHGGGVQYGWVCGWKSIGMQSPDYFHTDAAFSIGVQVPCHVGGFEYDKITGNKAYVGLYIGQINEPMFAKLTSPLLPNSTYQLSFDLSTSENTIFAVKPQIYFSMAPIAAAFNNNMPIADPAMFFTYPDFCGTKDGWKTVTFNIQTPAIAGQQYLYLGGLNAVQSQSIAATANAPGCGTVPQVNTYHLIDNVSLVPTNDGTFNLTESICVNQVLTDLASFVSGFPPNGVFTGSGVSLVNGHYILSGSTAGVGNHTVTYMFTNSLGCPIRIYSDIEVQQCTGPEPENCPASATFTTTEVVATADHQASGSIIASGSYIVNSGANITLRAGVSIDILPNSEIKAGSEFFAYIEECQFARVANASPEETLLSKDKFSLFPNPVKSLLSIVSEDEMDIISVISVDGRQIYYKKLTAERSHELNLGNYQSGIYIVIMTLSNGEIVQRKIIKK